MKKYAVLPCLFVAVLVYLPFHALLSTWFLSNFGFEVAAKGGKDALLFGLLIFASVTYKQTLRRFLSTRLGKLTALYVLMEFVMAAVSHAGHKSVLAGLVMNLRFVATFVLAYILAQKYVVREDTALKILLWPAAAVVVFGLCQMLFLPVDFLRHFGYGPNTIPTHFLIDNNPSLVRILSTLRGPNPLGAYMLIIISLAVSQLIVRYKKVNPKHVLLPALLFAGASLVLYGSGSRSAWIGTSVAVATIIFVSSSAPTRKKFAPIVLAALSVFIVGVFAIKNTGVAQKYLFHIDPQETGAANSDAKRLTSLQQGINDVKDEPFGRGVGSSGPASNYTAKTRIPENYLVQTAQETGIAGAVVFVLFCGTVTWRLIRAKRNWLTYAALGMWFGSLLVNMFWPAWTDETISVILFAVVGYVIGGQAVMQKSSQRGTQKEA